MKKNKSKVPPVLVFQFVNHFLNVLKNLQQKILPPHIQLINYTIESMAIPRCMYIVAELGIAEFLKDGPKTIEYLAKKTDANEDILYRIMRTLSGEGIFKESRGKYFETTRIGKALEQSGTHSVTPLIKWIGSDSIYCLWGDLMKTVKNGKSYFENNFGEDFFDWLKKHPKDQMSFNECLEKFSILSNEFIAAAYDFSSFGTLMDVAGGRGGQVISILKTHPKIKAALLELPLTINMIATDKVFEKAGLADRVKLIEGDFFQSVVPGYDAYFMKSILHDWNDEKAFKILSNCRNAMRNDSKLLISELVINEGNKSHFSRILDVAIAGLNNGRERTRAEYSILLEKVGFKLTKVIPTSSPYSIIEAIPC